MKRIVVLLLVLLLFIPVAFAENNNVADVSWWDGSQAKTEKLPLQVNDKYIYAELPDGTIAIVFYFGDEKTADIATSFPGKTISSINEGAFYFSLELTGKDKYKVGDTIYQCQAGKKLTRIIVPDTVKYLDNYWLECSSWHHYIGYNIPEQLQYAGNNSLSYLQISEIPLFHDVVFPEGWQFFAVSSDVLTFEQGYNSIPAYWCQWFKGKKIIIPEGVTTIGEAAFTYSGNLKDITLPASLTSIADDAFSGCDPKAVFTVFVDTYAEQWVKEHGYRANVLKPVTNISLNESDLTVNKGKTIYLKAKTEPVDATNKKLIWSSSDKAVATVSSSGEVITKGTGECDFICEAADGSGTRATCHITVIRMVSSIETKKQKVTLQYGETYTNEVTILPKDATNTTLNWVSSDETVCVVDADGVITAVGPGESQITVTTTDGSNKSKNIKVYVPFFSTAKSDHIVTEQDGLIIPVDLHGASVADVTHKVTSDKYFLYYFDKEGLHIFPIAEGTSKIILTSKTNQEDKTVFNVTIDKSALYDSANGETAPLKVIVTLDKSELTPGEKYTMKYHVSGGVPPYTFHDVKASSFDASRMKDAFGSRELNAGIYKSHERVSIAVTDAAGNTCIGNSNAAKIDTLYVAFDEAYLATPANTPITINYHIEGGSGTYKATATMNTDQLSSIATEEKITSTEGSFTFTPPSNCEYVTFSLSVVDNDNRHLFESTASDKIKITEDKTILLQLDKNVAYVGDKVTAILSSPGIKPSTFTIFRYKTNPETLDTEAIGSRIQLTPQKKADGSYSCTFPADECDFMILEVHFDHAQQHNSYSLKIRVLPTPFAEHKPPFAEEVIAASTEAPTTLADNIVSENGLDVCDVPVGLKYSISNGEVIITGYEGGNKELAIPNHIEEKPVTSIAGYAFYGCSNLRSITLPNNVTSIGDRAFYSCKYLRTIIIPDSVTYIGENAFANSGLVSVTIPSSVTFIGNNAFFGCPLSTIYIEFYSYAHEWCVQNGFSRKVITDVSN